MNKSFNLFSGRISKVTRRPILIQLADFGARTQISDLSLFGKQQRNTGKIDMFVDLFLKKIIQIFSRTARRINAAILLSTISLFTSNASGSNSIWIVSFGQAIVVPCSDSMFWCKLVQTPGPGWGTLQSCQNFLLSYIFTFLQAIVGNMKIIITVYNTEH